MRILPRIVVIFEKGKPAPLLRRPYHASLTLDDEHRVDADVFGRFFCAGAVLPQIACQCRSTSAGTLCASN
ncbi:hypothetical protein [Paraburkholderia sacchari]|uniref:hypothetical protein n=1 Tax=Paraburkholderia sacchari TaxID=159450 RepID=UPI001269B2DF|nr:hypothetical protein [Paraburkholderia sacchari]